MSRDIELKQTNGLPEELPKGEEILWQGRPDWKALSIEALSVHWVAGYFVLLALWRFGASVDIFGVSRAIAVSVPFLVLGAIACALLALIAFAQARMTVYTLTNRRVVMKIGAALTLTLNLPYTKIANAHLDLRRSGKGTIALQLSGPTRLSYLLCWPHVRPWAMRHTEPALRCIPDAGRVARLLADAAEARLSEPVVARRPARAEQIAAE